MTSARMLERRGENGEFCMIKVEQEMIEHRDVI